MMYKTRKPNVQPSANHFNDNNSSHDGITNMAHEHSLSTLPHEIRLIVLRFIVDELDVYVVHYNYKRRVRQPSAASQKASQIMTSLLLLNKDINSEVTGLFKRKSCVLEVSLDSSQKLSHSLPSSIIQRTTEIVDHGNSFLANPVYFDQLQAFPKLRKLKMKPIWWDNHTIYDEADLIPILGGDRNDALVDDALHYVEHCLSGAEKVVKERNIEITILMSLTVLLEDPEEGGLDVKYTRRYRGCLDLVGPNFHILRLLIIAGT